MASKDETVPVDSTPLSVDELRELLRVGGELAGRTQYVDKLAEYLNIALSQRTKHYLSTLRAVSAYPDQQLADALIYALPNLERRLEVKPSERDKLLRYLPEIKSELRVLVSNFCKEHNATVAQLAKDIELSESALHKILSDKNSVVPRETNLARLLKVLGLAAIPIKVK